MRLFFDPKRYNLGKVGRYKLNRKLEKGTSDEELDVVTLRKEDIVDALKYLIRLKKGDEAAYTDDIDHLGNRRIRSVGELRTDLPIDLISLVERMVAKGTDTSSPSGP